MIPDARETRQAHLSLRWETRHVWTALADLMGAGCHRETIPAIALALYAEASGQGRWTSYSRSKTHYNLPRRYRSRLYGYRPVVEAVDQLEALGMIHHEKALPGQRGWQSAICPAPELISLVEAITRGQLDLTPLREPIFLRDRDKNLIDYRDNRMTERMRRGVSAQNEMIMSTDFGDVLPFPGRLRRIFNETFDRGGRFYAEGGSWQTLPKAERRRIQIDGEPVVEIDYTAFHPALAYTECGLPPPAEPYAVPGFHRELVKIAFNILLNSSGRHGARHEIADKPDMARSLFGTEQGDNEDLRAFRVRLKQVDPTWFQRSLRAADQLIDALLEKHAPISAIFFTRAGPRLQRLDSNIAEGVMQSMRRRGITVLPIHDSFLVPASKANLLEEVMIDEAAKRGAAVGCKRSALVSEA